MTNSSNYIDSSLTQGTALHSFFAVSPVLLLSCISTKTSLHSNTRYKTIFLELLVIVSPLTLLTTIFADCYIVLNIFTFILFVQQFWYSLDLKKFIILLDKQNIFDKKLQCITNFRGVMYLITVYCILAVDFKCFPSIFSKSEKYGFSLMDVGVGMFIFSSSLVHKTENQNIKHTFKSNAKLIAILVILGFSRFFILREINYQQVVSEYGVHWNFFYTLAVTKFASVLILNLIDVNHSFVTGLFILILHEAALYMGLGNWVFSDVERDTFLSANREGIVSCPGYVAIYLLTLKIKGLFTNKSSSRKNVSFKAAALTVLIWLLTTVINEVRPSSRTLANFCYCWFVIAYGLTALTFFYVQEILFSTIKQQISKTPLSLKVANGNGLIFFLVGNLLTGFVNIVFKPLETFDQSIFSTSISITILHVYMLLALVICVYLDEKNIRL